MRAPIASPSRYAARRSPNDDEIPRVIIESTRYQTISYESAMNPDTAASASAMRSFMERRQRFYQRMKISRYSQYVGLVVPAPEVVQLVAVSRAAGASGPDRRTMARSERG